jgi:hypothetical protein
MLVRLKYFISDNGKGKITHEDRCCTDISQSGQECLIPLPDYSDIKRAMLCQEEKPQQQHMWGTGNILLPFFPFYFLVLEFSVGSMCKNTLNDNFTSCYLIYVCQELDFNGMNYAALLK